MSLARGLDYYTGIIYEATVEASAPEKQSTRKEADDEEEVDEFQVGVGSIAGGGRYDNLVGAFTSAAAGGGKKSAGIPCVGVSIGLDRIFAIVWPKWVEKGMRSKHTMAYVLSAGDGLLEERVALVHELREAGINVSIPVTFHCCVVPIYCL